jgi:hypothetical protein
MISYPMKSSRNAKATAGKPLVRGLKGFRSISAVEGVKLSASSKRMFADFETRGLSAEQCRKAIVEKHAKKA